jgi:hypothetical protein
VKNYAIANEARVFLPFKPKTLISLWDMIQFVLSDADYYRQMTWDRSQWYKTSRKEDVQLELDCILLLLESIIKFADRASSALVKLIQSSD